MEKHVVSKERVINHGEVYTRKIKNFMNDTI